MTPAPRHELYSRLQIDRQIISIGDEFLPGVEELSQRYIGSIVCGSLRDVVVRDNGGGEPQARQRISPTTIPLVDVYPPKKLRMVIFHRSVPFGLRNTLSAGRVMASMEANNSRKLHQMDEVGREYGQDPESGVVVCDTLGYEHTPGIGTELVLRPQAEHIGATVLNNQIKKCYDILIEGKTTKKVAQMSVPMSPYVPFAMLNPQIDSEQQARFVGAIRDLLPQRLVMGLVRPHSD